MKKITFYTLADKRPDFIPLQCASLNRYVQDEYEYVVINNAIDSKIRRKEIADICRELGIRCVDVQKDKRFSRIGGERVFSLFGAYRNPNVACAYPIAWAWDMMINENVDGLFSLIDSDMFICRDVSFNEEVGNSAGAAIVQYRGPQDGRRAFDVTYLWNAFFVFNPSLIPDLKQMQWDCGVVNEHPVDVGGFVHHWLAQHPDFSYRHISEFAIHKFHQVEGARFHIEGTLNGNYHFSFEYDRDTKATAEFKSYETGWQTGNFVLPHLPAGYEDLLMRKTVAYFETYILDKQSYPAPTFIGFLEFDNASPDAQPFIIHSKAGSGYMGFGHEYGKLKLQFIEQTLNL